MTQDDILSAYIDTLKGENAYLRQQVADLHRRVMELSQPGSNARLAWQPPPQRPTQEPAARVPASLRAIRSRLDLPTQEEAAPPEAAARVADLTRAGIEGSFSA